MDFDNLKTQNLTSNLFYKCSICKYKQFVTLFSIKINQKIKLLFKVKF